MNSKECFLVRKEELLVMLSLICIILQHHSVVIMLNCMMTATQYKERVFKK